MSARIKALYHEFTQGIPIIFVERFEDFAKRLNTPLEKLDQEQINGSSTFCRLISFKKSPLKFIVFEDQMLRTLFGGRKPEIIDATLALHVGYKKYPNNDALAMNHAIKLTVDEERYKAYQLLCATYERMFKLESPWRYTAPLAEANNPSDKPDEKSSEHFDSAGNDKQSLKIRKEKQRRDRNREDHRRSAQEWAEKLNIELIPGTGNMYGRNGVVTHKFDTDRSKMIPARAPQAAAPQAQQKVVMVVPKGTAKRTDSKVE